MQYLMKAGVQKSIGDYGQEFTALAKYGATTLDIYNEQNQIVSTGKTKTLPYNSKGNSLRVMIANDRPSAYRGIFISLFANQSTINTRCIIGYYRTRIQDAKDESKNSLVMGQHVLSNDRTAIRTDEPDTLEEIATDTVLVQEAKKTGKLKNVLRRSARQASTKPKWRTISMFLRRHPEMKKWAKSQGIVLRPENWRKNVRDFASDTELTDDDIGFALRGGKKNKPKNKKRRRKTKKKKRRKNKTKRKSRNKKQKSKRKRNKKRRNTKKRK